MCLIFWGIFSGLFVVLLLTYILLLIYKKVEKEDAIKFLAVVLFPLLILSVVLLPFAYRDLVTGDYPKPKEKPQMHTFYGIYADDNGKYQKIKLFENSVYMGYESHYSWYTPIPFSVDSYTEFEDYLKSLECYENSTVNDYGDTVITLSYDGRKWNLVRYQNSNGYKWYEYCIGSEIYKTKICGKGLDGKVYTLFKYLVNNYRENGFGSNRFIVFDVDDKAEFEEFLTSAEYYFGIGTDENGDKFFRFVTGESLWTLTEYNGFPNTYFLFYEAQSSEALADAAA